MKTRTRKRSFPQFVIVLLLIAILPILLIIVGERQELRQRAAPATTLTFSPARVTKAPGDRFPIDIIVDTGANTISAVKIVVNFDGTKLQAESMTASDFLPVILQTGAVTNGTASITLGSSPTAPKKGTGRLAEIIFKAKGPTGETQITFDSGTEVAGIAEQTNVLIAKGTAMITIAAGGSQASYPTPTPKRVSGTTQTTTQPSPPVSQPVGKVSFGSIGAPGNTNQQTSTVPIPLLTPIPQPAETIKDPVIIAYIKAILQFISSIFGR